MKFVLLYLHCCFYCDRACTVIELLELAIIIELVRLSLLGYASIYSNYICGCNVYITFVGSGVVICDGFSPEWFAHWLLLGLLMTALLDLSLWASPSWDFHSSFLSFYWAAIKFHEHPVLNDGCEVHLPQRGACMHKGGREKTWWGSAKTGMGRSWFL